MKKLLLLAVIIFAMTGCTKTSDKIIINTESNTHKVSESKEQETTMSAEDITLSIDGKETATIVTEAAMEVVTESLEIPNDGKLVRILDYIPDAFVDLRYATSNNFTGIVLYDDPEAYLCYGTVKNSLMFKMS